MYYTTDIYNDWNSDSKTLHIIFFDDCLHIFNENRDYKLSIKETESGIEKFEASKMLNSKANQFQFFNESKYSIEFGGSLIKFINNEK